MERRAEFRCEPADSIEVVVLGEGQECMAGQVVDSSARGMGLRLPSPLAAGSAIRIETGDVLILGEVTDCTPQNGSFRVGVGIKHRLAGLAGLHRLNRALGAESSTDASRPETVSMPTP